MSKPVDFALEYAARGLVVMPLRRLENKPHGMLRNGWSYDGDVRVGTTDPAEIKQMWSEGRWWRPWTSTTKVRKKTRRGEITYDEQEIEPGWEDGDPAANIGVVTGPRSGILVLDIDRKRRDGWASLCRWCEETGVQPPLTAVVRSPTLGGHIWMRLPPEAGVLRKIGWLEGVDALGGGQLVAVPPSARRVVLPSPKPWEPAGQVIREYEWTRGWCDTLENVPARLLEDIQERPPTITGREGDSIEVHGDLPKLERFRREGLGIYTSSRNEDCLRLSRRLFRVCEGDYAQVERLIYECWLVTPDQATFPWTEAQSTIRNAERYWHTRENWARRIRVGGIGL